MDSPGNYSLCGLGGENRKRSRIYSLLASHLPSPIFILKSENNSLVYNSSSRRGGFKIPHSCYSCFRLGYESASLPLRFNKNNKTNSTKTVSHTCLARPPPRTPPPPPPSRALPFCVAAEPPPKSASYWFYWPGGGAVRAYAPVSGRALTSGTLPAGGRGRAPRNSALWRGPPRPG